MENKVCFIRGILAGVMISIGGVINLSLDNKVAGALLFSIGLFYVCSRQYHLFTGKVGYALEEGYGYCVNLVFIWIGNFTGSFLTALLMRLTRQAKIADRAYELAQIKLGDSLLSIFILSFFCGILMYLAVDSFKQNKSDIGKHLAVVLSVMVFILCGFEHCVANMFYFCAAGVFSANMVVYLLVMTLGNASGSLVFAALEKEKGKR